MPIYADCHNVRFVAHPSNLGRPNTPWVRPKMVYLQHASYLIAW
ncbi:alpha/beta-hydrolase family protein [Mycobacterium lepromatosis]